MKFKVQTKDWAEAMALASSVKPKAVNSTGVSGYLCIVQGDTCLIHSEDEAQVKVRVPVPITDVEGEGAFVYPVSSKSESLKYLEGTVEFETGEEDGVPFVRYSQSTETTTYKLRTLFSFEPGILRALDKDFKKATKVADFSPALLKEMLSVTRPYLADPKDNQAKPYCYHIQLYDASREEYKNGSGYAEGSSGSRVCYFYSPSLEGKSLSISGLRVPLLQTFLSKSEGVVTVHKTEHTTYVSNAAGQVLGWSDEIHPRPKFRFHALNKDAHILGVHRALMERTLLWIKGELPVGKEHVWFHYDHEKQMLFLSAKDANGGEINALPMAAIPLSKEDGAHAGEKGKTEDLQFGINIDWFLDLVTKSLPADGGESIDLCVAPMGKFYAMRVLDNYRLDDSGKRTADETKGHLCKVMRFFPTK